MIQLIVGMDSVSLDAMESCSLRLLYSITLATVRVLPIKGKRYLKAS